MHYKKQSINNQIYLPCGLVDFDAGASADLQLLALPGLFPVYHKLRILKLNTPQKSRHMTQT